MTRSVVIRLDLRVALFYIPFCNLSCDQQSMMLRMTIDWQTYESPCNVTVSLSRYEYRMCNEPKQVMVVRDMTLMHDVQWMQ